MKRLLLVICVGLVSVYQSCGSEVSITSMDTQASQKQEPLPDESGGPNLGNPNNPAPVNAWSVDFRYLKVKVTKSGWVALAEIEVFDDQGQKIPANAAVASAVWANYPAAGDVQAQYGARNVIDGNYATVWNAGENYPGCNRNTIGVDQNSFWACIASSSGGEQTAWIKIDLGQTKKVSKIRLKVHGDSTNRRDEVTVSDDDSNYRPLHTFQGYDSVNPSVDGQWLEYPRTYQYFGAPRATILANGQKEITVASESIVVFSWGAEHADKIHFDYNPSVCGFSFLSQYPFGESRTITTYGALVGNKFLGSFAIRLSCSSPSQIRLTYQAIQSSGGLSASDTVVVNVQSRDANRVTFPDVNTITIAKNRSLTGSTNFVIGNQDISLGFQSSFNAPTFSQIPQGMTAVVSSWVTSNIDGGPDSYGNTVRGQANISISVPQTFQAGFYILRLNWPGSNKFHDVFVFVTETFDNTYSDKVGLCLANRSEGQCSLAPW